MNLLTRLSGADMRQIVVAKRDDAPAVEIKIAGTLPSRASQCLPVFERDARELADALRSLPLGTVARLINRLLESNTNTILAKVLAEDYGIRRQKS